MYLEIDVRRFGEAVCVCSSDVRWSADLDGYVTPCNSNVDSNLTAVEGKRQEGGAGRGVSFHWHHKVVHTFLCVDVKRGPFVLHAMCETGALVKKSSLKCTKC